MYRGVRRLLLRRVKWRPRSPCNRGVSMARIGRSIIAVLGGTALCFVVVAATDQVIRLLYPLPSGVDMSDRAAFAAAVAALPAMAFVTALAGWCLAVAAGAYAGARLARRSALGHGLAVTGIFLLATVANLLMVPHPMWLNTAAVVLVPLVGWTAARLGAHAPAAPGALAVPG
jgi:hypothetical protein